MFLALANFLWGGKPEDSLCGPSQGSPTSLKNLDGPLLLENGRKTPANQWHSIGLHFYGHYRPGDESAESGFRAVPNPVFEAC